MRSPVTYLSYLGSSILCTSSALSRFRRIMYVSSTPRHASSHQAAIFDQDPARDDFLLQIVSRDRNRFSKKYPGKVGHSLGVMSLHLVNAAAGPACFTAPYLASFMLFSPFDFYLQLHFYLRTHTHTHTHTHPHLRHAPSSA